jgi:8-oxo-dGTP pyrophosphatase MutT (NUDIX family)
MTDDPRLGWGALLRTDMADYGIFRIVRKNGVSPRTQEPVRFTAIEAPDWVQVLPFTTEGRLVMVEQFRPGAEVRSLEFPAGMIDAGEDARRAGVRELEEESGYRPGRVIKLGAVYANPAIQTNRLHVLLALECTPTGVQAQEAGEDVHVRIVDPTGLPALIRDGAINHALVLSAWQLYELWRSQRPSSRT